MPTLSVKPTFNRMTQTLSFQAGPLNMFAREEIYDSLNFYQNRFGLYSYMRLSQDAKYVLHTLSGTPLMWQPHNSCGWDPTGSLRIGRKELEPCRAKINEQVCYDELFDSCFSLLLQWNGTGPVNFTQQGADMVNSLVQTLIKNATLGARLTLTVGQLYNPSEVAFNTDTPNSIQDLFTRTIGTCRGWVELLKEMALQPGYGHLNVDLLDPADFTGNKFTGDVLDLYDALLAEAPADLAAMVNEGGVVNDFSNNLSPLFVVSTSIFNAVTAAYREQCVSVSCMNPRLTRVEENATLLGQSVRKYVYYIDDTPVIPVSDISFMDRYLSGNTHFAAITAAGNISLGGSFASLPDLENPNVGLVVQRITDVKNFGEYHFAAHQLMSSAIADTNFIVATQAYFV